MGSIRSTVLQVNIIVLPGFDNWSVKEKKPRNGRNPQTGEAMVLEERRVVKFKASPVLRRMMGRRLRFGMWIGV
jgi:integration host factor subunit alpha